MKIGRQWRFPAEQGALGHSSDPGESCLQAAAPARRASTAVCPGLRCRHSSNLAAELLGVMMVITDMAGEPCDRDPQSVSLVQ